MSSDYFTWFKDDDSELRALLYKLENEGIVKINRNKKGEFYEYKWELTKKGKEIVESDNAIKQMWEDKNIVEFYNKIMNKRKS